MKLKIVVFEDRDNILDIISITLKSRGYEVLGYKEPTLCPLYSDTTCLCPSEKPCADILITDNGMPNMTGLQFIYQQSKRGCKGVFKNKAIMSGAWEPEDLEFAESLGCKIFHKPVPMKDLFDWIKECEKRISEERW